MLKKKKKAVFNQLVLTHLQTSQIDSTCSRSKRRTPFTQLRKFVTGEKLEKNNGLFTMVRVGNGRIVPFKPRRCNLKSGSQGMMVFSSKGDGGPSEHGHSSFLH